MKKTLLFTMLCVLGLAHAAPAQNTASEIDSKVEVAYVCRGGDNQKVALMAMYGIKNSEIVVAQVRLGNQISPGMWRVPDMLLNRFVSQDETLPLTMWTTMPATESNIKTVNGGKLSFLPKGSTAHTIIVEDCQLNSAMTTK